MPPPPARGDMKSHAELLVGGYHMLVMRVIVLHPYAKFVVVVPKIWLIFIHGIKQPGDRDL